MEIDICDQYKYLGETINSKNNIENHIKKIEKKIEAALQTVLYVAGDDNFRGIELQTIWRLLETCIIPIITYGAETWDPNKSQTKKLNTILVNILKRILRIPQSTPRECIYEEMGTLDIQHRIILKRLNYYRRLQSKQEEAIKKIITNQHTNSWTTKSKLIVTGIGLKDLIQQSTKEAKNNIKKAVTIKMKQTIKQSGEEKSKYTFLTTNQSLTNSVETDYLTTLTRNQARALNTNDQSQSKLQKYARNTNVQGMRPSRRNTTTHPRKLRQATQRR